MFIWYSSVLLYSILFLFIYSSISFFLLNVMYHPSFFFPALYFVCHNPIECNLIFVTTHFVYFCYFEMLLLLVFCLVYFIEFILFLQTSLNWEIKWLVL